LFGSRKVSITLQGVDSRTLDLTSLNVGRGNQEVTSGYSRG
jgi:hypothetical protein